MHDVFSRMRIIESYLRSYDAGTGKSKYLGSLKELVDGLSSETFIFFDTETTGLDQHEDQITEIAAVVVHGKDFQEIDSMHARAALTDSTLEKIKNQKSGINLPADKRHMLVEDVLKMNRYYESALDPRTEFDILKEFKDLCSKHNALLVGHNPEFDLRMIGTKVGRIPNRGVWDTMLFARFFFHPMLMALEDGGDEKAREILAGIRNAKGNPSATLEKVLQALGEKTEGWHTAMADVRSTIKAFRGIFRYVQDHIDVSEMDSFQKYRSRFFKMVRDWKEHKNKGNPGTI